MPPRPSATALGRLGGAALLAAALAASAAQKEGTCPIPPAATVPAETEDSRRDEQLWTLEATQPLPEERRLDVGRVAAIIATIEAPKPAATSWWDRFEAWLNDLLRRQQKDSEAPAWLKDLLGSIDPWVAKMVFLGMLALLVIGLGALVIVELRAAGVGRRRAREARAASAAAPAAVRARRSLADIAALPLRDQPAALLQWAIGQLVERGILPADASLTNGELLAVLRSRAPQELPAFHRLTRAAEAAVYGAIEPAERETRELFDAARAPQAAAG